MQEPGKLSALDPVGRATWERRVRASVVSALDEWASTTLNVPGCQDERPTSVAACDWLGWPTRVANCLGRDAALELLDWSTETDAGGSKLQEEYIEWQVVRERDRIRRVELTTELPDYWRVLAAHSPEHLLETMAEFSGSVVPITAAFGALNPFAPDATCEQREAAFATTVLSKRAMRTAVRPSVSFCMVQAANTLTALARLAAAAACSRAIDDSRAGIRRSPMSSELIPLLRGAAVTGRASDPIIVERLARLAFEQRRIWFDDPLGVYIQGVQHTRLRTPKGEEVPLEWFRFSRGLSGSEAVDGRPRYQRLVFEVPLEERLSVGDLIDVATEQRIMYGGQVAELVQLAVFFRVSEPDALPEPEVTEARRQSRIDCRDVRAIEQHHRRAESA
jgi:hypothetical protein